MNIPPLLTDTSESSVRTSAVADAVSGVDVAALIVEILALILSGGAIYYSRREANAVASEHDANEAERRKQQYDESRSNLVLDEEPLEVDSEHIVVALRNRGKCAAQLVNVTQVRAWQRGMQQPEMQERAYCE